VAQTPLALSLDASTRGLINQMVTTFDTQLSTGLAGTAGVVYVDAYTQGRDQVANPGQYALTNVTTPACGTNALAGSSLVCNSTNLIAGDTSHYLYADSVHPTPFAHQLLAQFVAVQMAKAGWL
jgi:phospholipase/lecithinase/hemolysin